MVMAYTLVAYIIMACIVVGYVVMTCIVMAYIVAYVVMAPDLSRDGVRMRPAFHPLYALPNPGAFPHSADPASDACI